MLLELVVVTSTLSELVKSVIATKEKKPGQNGVELEKNTLVTGTTLPQVHCKDSQLVIGKAVRD